ncbi:MAG: hypothetical protein KGS72_23465 [Cyanobacteria bacterium REEB67]|nr:hypothetical protein [Cyanobacteria bacterium REEB67]
MSEGRETTINSQAESRPWPLWQRCLFRYWFCYIFLYLFPFPFSAIPGLHLIAIPWDMFVRALVNGSAAYCFHVTPDWSHAGSGSGDQLIRWIELATYAGFALPLATVWSILDRRRRQYRFLFTLLRIWSLTFVAANMLSYGAAKIIPSQFPPLHDQDLSQTVATKSPMGILWTFMSTSQPYTIFAGLAEFAAGLLLAVPVTRVLGALLCFAVATQIFMLNMCYDVPVKILSGHLLMLSFFLLLPDVKNLFGLFCLRKIAVAFPQFELFQKSKINLIFWICIWLFLAYYAAFGFIGSYKGWKSSAAAVSRKPGDYSGYWLISSCLFDGKELPSTAPASQRWCSMWVYKDRIAVCGADGQWKSYAIQKEPNGTDFLMIARDRTAQRAFFRGVMPDLDSWNLSGDVANTPCEIHLRRPLGGDSLLLNRGFHWVNEVPYNR